MVVKTWHRQGSRSSDLNDIFKRIIQCSQQYNFDLTLAYVLSSNPADAHSHALSDLDCMFSPAAWLVLQHRYGPHDFDLCALDSNAQRDREGHVLPHFTPWPTPAASDVNIFAQRLSEERNLYVFPPMVLVGPVLHFLMQSTHINVTMIVFDVHPRRYWWPLLRSPITPWVHVKNNHRDTDVSRLWPLNFQGDSLFPSLTK